MSFTICFKQEIPMSTKNKGYFFLQLENVAALDPALISVDRTVKKNSMNLLYFARWVNTCCVLSGELEVLWNCIHFFFFYCSTSKLMHKLERKTDLLKFQDTYSMQSTWMQMLLECSSSLHYEMCQIIISNANKSMHIIFSIATRGAIEGICMHWLILWWL